MVCYSLVGVFVGCTGRPQVPQVSPGDCAVTRLKQGLRRGHKGTPGGVATSAAAAA